jgi:hypothetical protein
VIGVTGRVFYFQSISKSNIYFFLGQTTKKPVTRLPDNQLFRQSLFKFLLSPSLSARRYFAGENCPQAGSASICNLWE